MTKKNRHHIFREQSGKHPAIVKDRKPLQQSGSNRKTFNGPHMDAWSGPAPTNALRNDVRNHGIWTLSPLLATLTSLARLCRLPGEDVLSYGWRRLWDSTPSINWIRTMTRTCCALLVLMVTACGPREIPLPFEEIAKCAGRLSESIRVELKAAYNETSGQAIVQYLREAKPIFEANSASETDYPTYVECILELDKRQRDEGLGRMTGKRCKNTCKKIFMKGCKLEKWQCRVPYNSCISKC